MKIIFNSALLFLVTACAPAAETREDDGVAPKASVPANAVVEEVDASSTSEWIAFDLDQATRVGLDAQGWDIAFQRYRIKTNGGISGTGGVTVARLEGEDFETALAPEDGYVADAPAKADAPTVPGQAADPTYAMGDWYDYEGTTHTLTPSAIVWVLKTSEGQRVKLALLSYYDDAGSPGHVRFMWTRL